MDAAYAMAGLSPTDISLLECHATGTPVGDAVEIQSASQVFHNAVDLPIGSLKSNLGHLITAAGLAGLLKVLGGHAIGHSSTVADQWKRRCPPSPIPRSEFYRRLNPGQLWTRGHVGLPSVRSALAETTPT